MTELRTDPQVTYSWPAITYALGSPSVSATRQKYGSEVAGTGIKHPAQDTEQVLAFWRAFSNRFAWDFLPVGFVHALYVHWMPTAFPTEEALGRAAFTGRLKKTAAATASGEWRYTRLRAASLLRAPEPLAELVPQWSVTAPEKAQYGLRRNEPTRERSAA